MLSFIDISPDIFNQVSQDDSQDELLSLLNNTIPQKMFSPLNAISNQCKIIDSLVKNFLDEEALNEINL